MIRYLYRFSLVCSCLLLLANCAPDIRDEVTKNPNPKVPFDELQAWPKPDADGIFQFDNRRYIEVRFGEDLYDIAKRSDEDTMVIAELNQINPDTPLQPGKVLLLPNRTPSSEELDATGYIVNDDIQSEFEIDIRGKTENYYRHRVQKGETAYTIAKLYGISVRTLADWNQLDADFAVTEGEILIIPAANQILEEGTQEIVETEPKPVEIEEKIEEPVTSVKEQTEEQTEVIVEETPTEEQEPVVVVKEPKPLPPGEIDCDNFAPAQFGFSPPLQGELVKDYSNEPAANKGIDIAAPVGSSVFAVGEGKVALISDLAEGTKVLLVLHDCNVFSIYQNLQDITLERGDLVDKGQKIGTLDSALGYLHFEIRLGPDSADPKEYLPSSSYTN